MNVSTCIRSGRRRARPGRAWRATRVLGALALLALAGCNSAPLAETQELPEELRELPPSPREVLAVGDLLVVNVLGFPELSSPASGTRIDAEGFVHLPAIEPIHVNGLTLGDARKALLAALSKVVRRPSAAIDVLEYAPRTVYVLGEVRLPGAKDLDRPLTALEALTLAGSYVAGADREQVAHLRRTATELEVRFFDAATPGVDGAFFVRPGDLIFVRQTGSGSFKEQILPVLQGFALPVSMFASIVLATDRLND